MTSWTMLVFATLVAFPKAFAETQIKPECVVLKIDRAGDCKHVKASFDLEKCGDAKPLLANVSDCNAQGAIFSGIRSEKQVIQKMKSSLWGDQWTWTPDGDLIVSDAKKKTVHASRAENPAVSASIPNAVPTKPLETPTPSPSPTAQDLPTKILKTTTIYGDFRYRHDVVLNPAAALHSVQQERIRARLGFKNQLEDDLLIDFRFATGTGRTSTNQTFTGGDANYQFQLDRAYFKWNWMSWSNLYGGRTPNAFYLNGMVDFIWDSDVNLDGLFLANEWKIDSVSPFVNLAFTWIQKGADLAHKDSYLLTAQTGFRSKVNDWLKANASFTYYSFVDMQGNPQLDGVSGAGGNTVSGPQKNYVYPYHLINPGFELTAEFLKNPLTFYGEFVQNISIAQNKSGYETGFRYGRFAKRGDIQVCVDYRHVEKDAAVAAFSDGETFAGGTDLQGFRFCGSYKVRDTWHVGLTYFTGERGIAPGETPSNQKRIQADLVFYF